MKVTQYMWIRLTSKGGIKRNICIQLFIMKLIVAFIFMPIGIDSTKEKSFEVTLLSIYNKRNIHDDAIRLSYA